MVWTSEDCCRVWSLGGCFEISNENAIFIRAEVFLL
jgi:hypothetical protein